MIDWKLFAGTFVLIFLAELGDKTQLTAMARATASDGAKWTVFFAASAALVFSTLIAVLLGEWLSKTFDPRHIKLVAGVLFLVFGALLMSEVFRPETPEEEVAAPAGPATGFLAHVAFEIADSFETAAVRHYRDLADSAKDPELRKLLETLAAEEEGHLQHVRGLAGKHAREEIAGVVPDATIPTLEGVSVSDSDNPREFESVLHSVIEHENAKAEFYALLAHDFHIPGLKAAFRQLAAEERDHARRIQEILKA